MNFNVRTIGELTALSDDALILLLAQDEPLPPSAQEVDTALGGTLSALLTLGDFTGSSGALDIVYPHGSFGSVSRLIVTGLGQSALLTADTLRRAVAQAVIKARDLGVVSVALLLPAHLDTAVSVEAVAEGAELALYRYHGQKSTPAPADTLTTINIILSESGVQAANVGIKTGSAIAEGTNFARQLINLPPNIATPTYLAEQALLMSGRVGLRITILDRGQMQALRMGALLSVAQAAATPPKFIIMEHNPDRTDLPIVVLVGKGVTFDTGGYSIKTADGMVGMKADMSGGAAVIGAMLTIATLKLPIRVIGLVPSVENAISGEGFRPQDVVIASNGKSIEIISTDAEGRMLLADALVYARRCNPAAVVDIATLTGASARAMGSGIASSLFTNHDTLRDQLVSASEAAAERIWPMPLWPVYRTKLKSDTADMKNSGGASGGVGTSAAFLQEFAEGYSWAHIDMASMDSRDTENPYHPVGSLSGYGTRLLIQFVRAFKPF